MELLNIMVSTHNSTLQKYNKHYERTSSKGEQRSSSRLERVKYGLDYKLAIHNKANSPGL